MRDTVQGKVKHVLNVKMLSGRVTLTLDGTPIQLTSKTHSKPTALFILVAYYGEEGVSRETVLEQLFEEGEVLDGAGNLRVIAHRLRKNLIELGIWNEQDHMNEKGLFHLNQEHLEVTTDVRRFEALLRSAETEGEHRENALREACALYQSDFLEEFSSVSWVAGKQVYYRDLYFDGVRRYLQVLEPQRKYAEMLRIVQKVSQIYPYEEWYLAEMDILLHMEQWQMALEVAERADREMTAKMNVHPSSAMRDKVAMIRERLRGSYQSLQEICDKMLVDNDQEGASYFSYTSFVETYRYEIRTMEHNGRPVCLALYSMVDAVGGSGSGQANEFERRMELLGDAIRISLRRTDIYTRYDRNQYLILIYGVEQKNCGMILSRVDRTFRKLAKAGSYELYTSIMPVQWDEARGGSISAEIHYAEEAY